MKKYSAPCGVAKQKKDDLPKLCTKNLIPARHHAFYEALPVNTNQKDDTEKPSPKKKKKCFCLMDTKHYYVLSMFMIFCCVD